MLNYNEKIDLLTKLKEIGALQYGNFILKSGQKSNLYFDLRMIYSYPKFLKQICNYLMRDISIESNLICGIPTAGIPYATTISVTVCLPMIILRNNKKEYGTQKLVEGVYRSGDKVLLIEDVITTGSSIKETIEKLNDVGLEISEILVIVDRQVEPSKKNMINNIPIKTLLNLDDIAHFTKMMDNDEKILENKIYQRTLYHPMAQRLYDIMLVKKTNLCVSADVETFVELINLANQLGDEICLLKVHFDIYNNGIINNDADISIKNLYRIARIKNFLILDDRKYSDIGKIVQRQLKNSIATNGTPHSITVQTVFGQGTLAGLETDCISEKIGSFLVAETSSQNSLITKDYTEKSVQLAYKYRESVAGFITQHHLGDNRFLYLTPGVNLTHTDDLLQQGYRSIEDAIVKDKCDIIIVGKGIYQTNDPLKTCQKYRKLAWKTFSNNV